MNEKLEYLLISEEIQRVYKGEITPKDFDNRIANMEKEIRELKHMHMLDMAQIVEQRRQIDFLMGA